MRLGAAPHLASQATALGEATTGDAVSACPRLALCLARRTRASNDRSSGPSLSYVKVLRSPLNSSTYHSSSFFGAIKSHL